jgi:hypothetical protein
LEVKVMIRILLLIALITVVLLTAWAYNRHKPPPSEPTIVSDETISDPRCFDMIRRVARREPSTLEAVRNGREPIGMRCSNFDIRDTMKSEGAYLVDQITNTLRFGIRSKERWLFSKRSRFGSYQYDTIVISKNSDGVIEYISITSPYIT